ncbi:hypothetical protein B5G11_11245 [Drancourtella sp. An57]|uniref:hypothetical protein n=1 Tax=Drancourtella sp. An57 TaxID=1965647 RepID=UPI000B36FE23|nr:hypothetical protein [Drancourtella sp. An57]OUN68961.1 hypothetical protein B5G11_11245 [Drancourtella sp. An57]
MKKFLKRSVALLLSATLCFALCPTALAAEKKTSEDDLSQTIPDETKEYYIYVDDGNGNMIPILVQENTYHSNDPVTRATPGQSESGGYRVGDIKTVTTRISNASISSSLSKGTVLSFALKSKLATLILSPNTAAVGATIGGGLAVATVLGRAIVDQNVAAGNNGFVVTTKYKWGHFVNNIQGTDYYDWSFVSVTIGTY